MNREKTSKKGRKRDMGDIDLNVGVVEIRRGDLIESRRKWMKPILHKTKLKLDRKTLDLVPAGQILRNDE